MDPHIVQEGLEESKVGHFLFLEGTSRSSTALIVT